MHSELTPTRHRGLTLTETATALVLLAIGVLCIATVYLERSQAAPAVLLHSKANRLAEEMAARMRVQSSSQVHFENPVGVRCNPQLADVPPQQFATNDIACWQDKVAQTLPNGSGAITHDSQHLARAYLITVSWSPPDRGTASYLLRVEMPNENSSAPTNTAATTVRTSATTSEVRAARAAN
jgi:type IV pilus modification protein PilV